MKQTPPPRRLSRRSGVVLLLTGAASGLAVSRPSDAVLAAYGQERAARPERGEGRPAFDLVLQSVEFSTPRLLDGGQLSVRVGATTPSDVQPRSCSGDLVATGTSIELPFSSCSARSVGPSRYEFVLKREFPAAAVNRAFHLGNLVLSGSMGERYVSGDQPGQKLEVISTAVMPDLRNARVELRSESGARQIRPGDRFRIDLYVDSATPVEAATFFVSLFPRDGPGVDGAQLVVRGEGHSALGWIGRVERNRLLGTQSLTVYAKVPEDLRGIAKLEVRYVQAMNQSLQYVELSPKGLELDIED